jgi:hypothetical protein
MAETRRTPPPLPEGSDFAGAVRTLVWARGYGKADLARRLGGAVHPSEVYRVMNGFVRQPGLRLVVHLCWALDIEPTALLVRAGLWPRPAPLDPLDRCLRALEERIARWPTPRRQRVLRLLETLGEGPDEGEGEAPA